MTILKKAILRCGVCKKRFHTRNTLSTNAFGSPDLDLRPPPMQRFTLHTWAHKCPHCGYVHSEIEKPARIHKRYIRTEEYITCQGNTFEDELTAVFYKHGLILLREEKPQEAYAAFLHGAWAADDQEDKRGADVCRNKAISLNDGNLFGDNVNLQLRHVDLLRRVGKFEQAMACCDGIETADLTVKKVVEFQRKLCALGDTDGYRISDCDLVFMKLYDRPFALMESGQKTIEVRCNDEKRRLLKVGDRIYFYKDSDPKEKMIVRVKELHAFSSFLELYRAFPMERFGCAEETVDGMVTKINEIYSKEKQEKYGALAIVISRGSTLSELLEGL